MQVNEEIHFDNGTYINKYGEFINPNEIEEDEDNEYNDSEMMADAKAMNTMFVEQIPTIDSAITEQMPYYQMGHHYDLNSTTTIDSYNFDDIEEILKIDTKCNNFPCSHKISVKKTDGTVETDSKPINYIWSLFEKFDYPIEVFKVPTYKLASTITHFHFQGFGKLPDELEQKIKDKLVNEGYKISTIKKGQSYLNILKDNPQITYCKKIFKKPTINLTVFKQFQPLESVSPKYVFTLPITPDIDLNWLSGIDLLGDDLKKVPKSQINKVKLILSDQKGDYTEICTWYGKLLTKSEEFNLLSMIPLKFTEKTKSISVIIDADVNVSSVYAYIHNEEYIKSKIISSDYYMNSYDRLYEGPLKREVIMDCNGFYYQLRFCLINRTSGYKHVFPNDVVKCFSLEYKDEKIYQNVPFALIKCDSVGKLEFGMCAPITGQVVGRVFTEEIKLTLDFMDEAKWKDYDIVVCGLVQRIIEIAIPYNTHSDTTN